MIYGNESDTSETYCYVKIEPWDEYYGYDWRARSMMEKVMSFLGENPYGVHEVFKNKYGDLQIKSGIVILIECSCWTDKENKVSYGYPKNAVGRHPGNYVVGGIIREWSKKPINPSINKIEEYKKIQNKIDELKAEQRMLFNNNYTS